MKRRLSVGWERIIAIFRVATGRSRGFGYETSDPSEGSSGCGKVIATVAAIVLLLLK